MLAKGFEVLISQSWPGGLAPGMPEKLWQLDQAVATQIAEYTASQCFDPLCRKYVEDNRGVYPSRPHGDLTLLVAGLSETVRDFLISRCSVGGDLYECLVDPLADDDNYFIDNGRPMDPASSCGDPIQDVLRLSLAIYDEDNSNDIKRKLIHFVRHDPWLFAEWRSFVQEELSDREQKQQIADGSFVIDQATDDFIFRATHLQGKTPIQLLIERQKNLSERQKQRMQRWDRETFCGTFLVYKKRLPFLDVTDLKNDKNCRLKATMVEAIQSIKPGDLLCSRVTPWEDYWLLSGIQNNIAQAGRDQTLIAKLKQEARCRPSYRFIDNDDPQIQEGFKVQDAQYQAWTGLFHKEELLFEDGLELGAAMNRFHRYWTDEMILPDSGLTRSQLYQQRHGHAPPELNFRLPDYLLNAQDVAVVFDRRYGLAFYVGYGLFRSAFEMREPLTSVQIERVWDYLIAESVDYWLFQRMRDQYPQRTEYVFKETLKDEQFCLDRDFDSILRKFKGEAMRRPLRSMITIVDSESEIEPSGKVMK